MPEGERGDDREELERGLNDIETTRERMIGGKCWNRGAEIREI